MDEQDIIKELEEELKIIGVEEHPLPPAPAITPAQPAEPLSQLPQTTPVAPAPAIVAAVVPAVPAPVALPATQSTPAPVLPAIIPPVPTPQKPNTPEHHEVMGQMLTKVIQQGKNEVPHEPDPLVAKPHDLESWRVFKIMSEFVEGFELLSKYGKAATFFGSARQGFAARYYDEATALAGKLAKAGLAVITGGASGIMEAANKGAFEAGGASVGLNIRLGTEQGMNKYLTDSMLFEHFFVRKVMLTYASEVYIYFPGGFGTIDEFSEIITLVQTQKIRKIPIVLYGREYWESFTKIFEDKFLHEYNAISPEDLALYKVVDSVDEAYLYISDRLGIH